MFVEWILDMDTRCLSITKTLIRQKAELLVAQHVIDELNILPSIESIGFLNLLYAIHIFN